MKSRSVKKLRIKIEEFGQCPTLSKSLYNLPEQLSPKPETLQTEHTFTLHSDDLNLSQIQRNTQTPEFSHRLSFNQSPTSTTPQTTSSKVLQTIKTQFKHFNNNPVISKQLQSVNKLLKQIQTKLSSSPRFHQHSQNKQNFKEFDSIKKLQSPSQCSTMGGILYTNFNLTDFVENEDIEDCDNVTPKRRRSSLLGLDHVDNIEYYKILYLLGENHMEKNPQSVFDGVNIDMESPTVKELNMEIQMLDNMLKMKDERNKMMMSMSMNKNMSTNGKKDESLKSTRNILDVSQKYQYQQRSALSPLKEYSNSMLEKIGNRSSMTKVKRNKLSTNRSYI